MSRNEKSELMTHPYVLVFKSSETLGCALPGLADHKIFNLCGCYLTLPPVINGAQNALSPAPDTLSDFLPQTTWKRNIILIFLCFLVVAVMAATAFIYE